MPWYMEFLKKKVNLNKPKINIFRTYKNFQHEEFKMHLAVAPWHVWNVNIFIVEFLPIVSALNSVFWILLRSFCLLSQSNSLRMLKSILQNAVDLARKMWFAKEQKFLEVHCLRVCPWENQAEPGRRWYSSNHRFCSNSAQMLGLVSKWSWQKTRSKYFIPSKLGGPPPKMAVSH